MAGSEQQASRVTAEYSTPNPKFANPPLLPGKNAAEEFLRPSKRPRTTGNPQIFQPPPPMTAAAALAEARQRSMSPMINNNVNSNKTSPNPAAQALGALMGVSQNAVSQAYTSTDKRSQDPAKAMSTGVATAAEHMQPRTGNGNGAVSTEQSLQTSPQSVSSFDTSDSIAAPSGPGTTVASPLPIEDKAQTTTSTIGAESASSDDNANALVFSTPLLQPQATDGRRGMSLPHSGLRQNTRSPSSRRHRCPYCATEFTRHHNLKSHLLTHSQEKPYVCSTCQSRFRRLHDLKRHTKLHTGERPHVCPKCNRKFARGDALARHTKGPGGCAGRRASMGSFAGEDDFGEGDDSMEGVMYGEPETMDDIEGDISKGTPSIRRQAPSGDEILDDQDHHSRLPSTYPPLQGRPPGGIASGQFPPRPSYAPSSGTMSSTATSSGPPSMPYPPSSTSSSYRPSQAGSHPGSLFAQNPLSESPKPISPNQPQNRMLGTNDVRHQSPNMLQFQAPQPFGRVGGPGSGPAPQLPPPQGLNPPDSRYTLPSQGAPTHPPTQPSGPPTHMSNSGPLSSHSNSLSSHGQSGHNGSGDAGSLFNNNERMWAFMKDLERKVVTMQDEINTLKSQLAVANAQQVGRP